MGKYKFTTNQFDEIALLLRRRLYENRSEQKKTRAKIRKLGFMISDYQNGFSDLDFKKLFEDGEIEITTRNNLVITPLISKSTVKRSILLELNKTKKSLPPVVDKNTQYLVLGTMPGEQSLSNQEYYNNPKNQFWDIISAAF